MNLFKESCLKEKIAQRHKKFVEYDISGIDIMPFAAHMSALNLTMQNLSLKTNLVRIVTLMHLNDKIVQIDHVSRPKKALKLLLFFLHSNYY